MLSTTRDQLALHVLDVKKPGSNPSCDSSNLVMPENCANTLLSQLGCGSYRGDLVIE